METTTIQGTMTINETIRACPETVAVFDRYGLDSCCGGSLEIQEAARRHGLDAEEVLAALNASAPAGS